MKTHQFNTPLARDLFALFSVPQVNLCNECGRPAIRKEFHRDWCEDCLAVVDKEMDDMEQQASAQERAIHDEMDRLYRAKNPPHRGTPHEI